MAEVARGRRVSRRGPPRAAQQAQLARRHTELRGTARGRASHPPPGSTATWPRRGPPPRSRGPGAASARRLVAPTASPRPRPPSAPRRHRATAPPLNPAGPADSSSRGRAEPGRAGPGHLLGSSERRPAQKRIVAYVHGQFPRLHLAAPHPKTVRSIQGVRGKRSDGGLLLRIRGGILSRSTKIGVWGWG